MANEGIARVECESNACSLINSTKFDIVDFCSSPCVFDIVPMACYLSFKEGLLQCCLEAPIWSTPTNLRSVDFVYKPGYHSYSHRPNFVVYGFNVFQISKINKSFSDLRICLLQKSQLCHHDFKPLRLTQSYSFLCVLFRASTISQMCSSCMLGRYCGNSWKPQAIFHIISDLRICR